MWCCSKYWLCSVLYLWLSWNLFCHSVCSLVFQCLLCSLDIMIVKYTQHKIYLERNTVWGKSFYLGDDISLWWASSSHPSKGFLLIPFFFPHTFCRLPITCHTKKVLLPWGPMEIKMKTTFDTCISWLDTSDFI